MVSVCLFSGSLAVALLLGDPLFKSYSVAGGVVYKTLVFGITFLWFFALSYALIKIARLLVRGRRA